MSPGVARRRAAVFVGTAVVMIAAVAIVLTMLVNGAGTAAVPSAVGARAEALAAKPIQPLSAARIRALSEAKYDAVIPGLVAYRASRVPAAATRAYSLRADAALYDAVNGRPVARFAARNFLGEPTVVVPVEFDGRWALVLTPSRNSLPSDTEGSAPAQTAAWIARSDLIPRTVLRDRIVISVSKQQLSVVGSSGTIAAHYAIGVGAARTPTPTGVVGYLQSRYLDPSQGQADYPIELTSLHATASDEPYEGHDGGLIGMHHHSDTHGAVSRGCLRLPGAALDTIAKLPLGTPVLMTS
ncbi:L,D-transpeptidase [uncultured Amnibacterium sp.]|uniref:L,D-transpeptidase n=1 Tax=uncultured Amnibacterium sp. TaxID=1631851 RepID=UPI0035CC936D